MCHFEYVKDNCFLCQSVFGVRVSPSTIFIKIDRINPKKIVLVSHIELPKIENTEKNWFNFGITLIKNKIY